MGFRTYIIHHEKEEAWLTQILADGKEKVYRYMPDVGMAMQIETLTEARRIAGACRGRVQTLRRGKDGEPYAAEVTK